MTTGPRPGWFPVILLVPITRWLAGAVSTTTCTGG